MFAPTFLVVCLVATVVAESSNTWSQNLTTAFTTAMPSDYDDYYVDIATDSRIGDYIGPYEWSSEWPDEWLTDKTLFPFYSKLEDRQELSERLLLNYNKHILPYSGRNAFNISINVSLVAVGEIDELEEKLSTVLWLTYKWVDENIHWEQEENAITDVTFGWIDVWRPVMRVDNPHADSSNRQTPDRSFDSVIYTSNGSAEFDEMMITRTTCDLDMTNYPFDIQTCTIKLSVVGESKFPFQLKIHLNEQLSSSDSKHGSWALIYKNTKTYPGRGRFEIEFKFERRPLFILLNILLPIIVLALLTPSVFILPKKSGERVGFSITMLLAISVYMTIVSDHLPQNSEPMPLILIMMFVWYIMDSVIVFIVIINSRINTMKNNRPFPNCLRIFIRITRQVFYREKKQISDSHTSQETKKCIDINKETENVDELQGQQNDISTDEDRKDQTWQFVSHCVDRWCFVVFYALKITIPVVFFSVMKTQSRH